MATELEELVEFLHHDNLQIRQIAVENLVGYSSAEPEVFKRNDLEPITDLQNLVNDPQNASNAITILINLSEDMEVVDHLVKSANFTKTILDALTSTSEVNADLFTMLLANLSHSDTFNTTLLTLAHPLVENSKITSPLAIDQLLDLFVKGSEGLYNPVANFDYLSYVFADIAKLSAGRDHFLMPRVENSDSVVPISKMVVFTSHASEIRRRGIANTLKNICFNVESHQMLVDPHGQVNLLPYLLLPLMGGEEYKDEDTDDMLVELQFLADDKVRESDVDIITTHLESLLLLTSTKEVRDVMRKVKVYPIIRELHLQVEDEDVRDACDRFVQVIMRDEEGEGEDGHGTVESRITELKDGEDDVENAQEKTETKPDKDEDESLVAV